MPMGTLTPWTTMPRRPSKAEVTGLLEDEIELQHDWANDVVATARIARDEIVANLKNIVMRMSLESG